jgi:hypothetical protein
MTGQCIGRVIGDEGLGKRCFGRDSLGRGGEFAIVDE